jgi:ARC6-like, IMS domain
VNDLLNATLGERPEIVKKLEGKIQALLRDRQLATQAVGGGDVDRSPLTGYEAITRDPNVTTGVRYLALHCIASKQALYDDPRAPAQMLGVMSDEMGQVPLPEVVRSIQNIRLNYGDVYQVDAAFFDRAEANAKELMSRLPEDQQGQASATAVGTNLKPVPIAPEPPPVVTQPAPTYVATPMPMAAPAPTFVPEAVAFTSMPPASQIYTNGTPVVTGINQPLPNQGGNKNALIVGGGMIAGAIMFSAIVLSQQMGRNGSGDFTTNYGGSSSSVSNSSNPISQEEAVGVVQAWLNAKKVMFAPPYDQQIGTQLATGKTFSDKVKGPSSDGTPESSLEWLRKYGFYYTYGVQKIEEVKGFESDGNRASIEIQLLEDVNLYNNKGVLQPKRSGVERKAVRYILTRDNGILKISDYNNVGSGKRES